MRCNVIGDVAFRLHLSSHCIYVSVLFISVQLIVSRSTFKLQAFFYSLFRHVIFRCSALDASILFSFLFISVLFLFAAAIVHIHIQLFLSWRLYALIVRVLLYFFWLVIVDSWNIPSFFCLVHFTLPLSVSLCFFLSLTLLAHFHFQYDRSDISANSDL